MYMFQVSSGSNKVSAVIDYLHKLHTYSQNKVSMYDVIDKITGSSHKTTVCSGHDRWEICGYNYAGDSDR